MKAEYSQHPKAVEIQTTSFCNSFCAICPYSESSLVNPKGVMDMVLFKKIIDRFLAGIRSA